MNVRDKCQILASEFPKRDELLVKQLSWQTTAKVSAGDNNLQNNIVEGPFF